MAILGIFWIKRKVNNRYYNNLLGIVITRLEICVELKKTFAYFHIKNVHKFMNL